MSGATDTLVVAGTDVAAPAGLRVRNYRDPEVTRFAGRDRAGRVVNELILHETGVPVHIADDPLRCVARGAGMALDYIEVIERSLPTEEETMITEAAR